MNRSIEVRLIAGPLPQGESPPVDGAGAVVLFEGIVRPTEQGRRLESLCYEAYEPMTSRELRRVAQEVLDRHGLQSIQVEHSMGQVRVGEISFRLTVASAHRAEALAAVAEFIDTMKAQVPLWKVPLYEVVPSRD